MTLQITHPSSRLSYLRQWHKVALASAGLLALALPIAWFTGRSFAEAQVRQRIISSLGERLHATVTVDPVHLMFQRGIRLEATNIRAVPLGAAPGSEPILTLAVLHARVSVANVLFHSAQDLHVAAHGLVIHLSANTRQLLSHAATGSTAHGALPLERLVVADSTFRLEPTIPGKPAVIIQCTRLVLDNLDDTTQPAAYTADLAAPIPGLHAAGHFGPLNLAQPRDTFLDGNYQIENAPLGLVPGLTGKVSSSGTLRGTLGHIAIDGQAQSPDFALDVSAHPFPVSADYRAVFDLTSGDIALPALSAHFLRTTVQATGFVDRQPRGRHLTFNLHIRDGRNEDVLAALSPARPPFSSNINLESKLDIPAGAERLLMRIHATGQASLSGILWTNPSLQSQINSISMRASDHADQAADQPASIPLVYSNMTGNFNLGHANIGIDHLVYTVPGAAIIMDGSYPLLAGNLEFHGLARTVATASHMETGIKSVLLLPISPFLKKNGSGMQIPISFTGDKSSPALALDLGHLRQEKAISRGNPRRPHL